MPTLPPVGDGSLPPSSQSGAGQAPAPNYAVKTDPRFPTSGEKAALAGTDGTPSGSNKFVTDSDARLTGGGGGGSGTVTSFSIVSANGFSGSVATATTTPTLTINTLAFSSLGSIPTTLAGYGITDAVPITRTVNGHALSANVTVTAADLSLVIGTNVQAWDADLDAFAVLTSAANKLPYFTGSHTMALADFTPAGFSLTLSANATIGGTNTGDQTTVSGNAGSATVLQTARNINGVSFDGSADITVAAAAGTLTGATLASGVTASSLISFGSSPTLTTPTIASLVNAAHTHQDAAGGGTLDAAALASGVLAAARIAGLPVVRVTALTGSGTFTLGAGATKGLVFIGAGGGGGGGSAAASLNTGCAGGGAAGSWAIYLLTSTSGQSYAIGGKGTGGSAGNNSGNPGTDSTFAGVTCKGGNGGTGGAAGTATGATAGGASQTGTGGTMNFAGEAGGYGTKTTSIGSVGGAGGASPWGSRGSCTSGASGGAAGNAAAGYCAGGGGGCTLSTGTKAGGDGADGFGFVIELA